MGRCFVPSRYRTTAKRLPSGDTTVQMRIEGLVGFAHATCADGLQDLVSAEFGAAIQTHPRIPFRLPPASQTDDAIVLRMSNRRGHKEICSDPWAVLRGAAGFKGTIAGDKFPRTSNCGYTSLTPQRLPTGINAASPPIPRMWISGEVPPSGPAGKFTSTVTPFMI